LDDRSVALGQPRRQARRRLHVDVDAARRPGVDAARDGAAARPPRHALGRAALYARGAVRNADRRLAVRRVARGRAVESDAVQRRERACPRARRTGRTARDQAEGPEPEVRSDTLVVAVWLCHGVLLAAVTVGLMTMELMLSGRVALAIAAALPLAAAIPGLVRRRRYTYLWLAFALVGYAGAA